MNCSQCQQFLPETARFCPGCGQITHITCPACESEVDAGTKFCPSCGTVIGGTQTTSSTPGLSQYCAASGRVIRPEDEHFKCSDCEQLYLEPHRFRDTPVCERCAQEQRMATVQAEEEAREQARAEAERVRIEAEVRQQLTAQQAAQAETEAETEAEARTQAAPQQQGRLYCPVTGMAFVDVPGGDFDMGDIWGDAGNDEKPVHSVSLRPFLLSTTPVTQSQWRQVMGGNPSKFTGEDRPVESVNWDDAQSFICRLNSLCEGRRYRLPTEAEWEYACRSGGNRHKWSGTSDKPALGDYAWYRGNSDLETHPVAQKSANELGLYDMSGNVWEWCEDTCHKDYKGAPNDGSAWLGGDDSQRVIRGGSWGIKAENSRSAHRNRHTRTFRYDSVGFRLALDT